MDSTLINVFIGMGTFAAFVVIEGWLGWKANNDIVQFFRPTVYKVRKVFMCSTDQILNLDFSSLEEMNIRVCAADKKIYFKHKYEGEPVSIMGVRMRKRTGFPLDGIISLRDSCNGTDVLIKGKVCFAVTLFMSVWFSGAGLGVFLGLIFSAAYMFLWFRDAGVSFLIGVPISIAVFSLGAFVMVLLARAAIKYELKFEQNRLSKRIEEIERLLEEAGIEQADAVLYGEKTGVR